MVNRIDRIKIDPLKQNGGIDRQIAKPAVAFQDILQGQLQDQKLKFSAHAMNRLEQRSIGLNGQTVVRLENAVKQAAAKGARQSLIMVDDLAFVVSVANKTVITALDGESRKESVFTNIDSAVIA